MKQLLAIILILTSFSLVSGNALANSGDGFSSKTIGEEVDPNQKKGLVDAEVINARTFTPDEPEIDEPFAAAMRDDDSKLPFQVDSQNRRGNSKNRSSEDSNQ